MAWVRGSGVGAGTSRERILDAAVAGFTARGYRPTSLLSIAEAAGLSKSGLLHHFPTKEALLAAVLEERIRLQSSRVPPGESGFLRALESAVRVNDRDLDWVRFFSIIVAESLTDGHPARAQIRGRYRETIDAFTSALREEGLPQEAAERWARIMIAVVDGLQIQKSMQGNEFDMLPLVKHLIGKLREEAA